MLIRSKNLRSQTSISNMLIIGDGLYTCTGRNSQIQIYYIVHVDLDSTLARPRSRVVLASQIYYMYVRSNSDGVIMVSDASFFLPVDLEIQILVYRHHRTTYVRVHVDLVLHVQCVVHVDLATHVDLPYMSRCGLARDRLYNGKH